MFARDEGNAAMALGPSALALPNAGGKFLREQLLKSQGNTVADAPDIRELTAAIRRGDAAAFARFYDFYSFRIYKFLLVLTRGDENDAREICQAVFIKLAKRIKVVDDEGQLWAWLCALSKNTFIDHYRARQRQNRFVSLDDLPPEPLLDGAATRQLSEILRDTLEALPPEERELIQAAYVDERPLRELADASGDSYKAVESRLARLRQKLKEQLLKKLRHEHES